MGSCMSAALRPRREPDSRTSLGSLWSSTAGGTRRLADTARPMSCRRCRREFKFPSKQFGGWFNVKRIPAVFGPVIEAFLAGETELVHCVNGRHRSTQACCGMVSPFFDTVDGAWNLVWSLRHLAEFSCLAGSAGSVGPRRSGLAPDKVSP